ncbi:hypothetical protein, partial [Enterococcus casseliflavus]|uniref:hypothetical protein n=1 Tax=Enterococcus casseliflavus TaxID=37734 RepID=UPI003D130A75
MDDAGVDAGGGVFTCALTPDEREPNDRREDATAYTLEATVTGCVGAAADVDLFAFTLPAGA